MSQKTLGVLATAMCVLLLGNVADGQEDGQIEALKTQPEAEQPLNTGSIQEIDLSLTAKLDAPDDATRNIRRSATTALTIKNYQWTASNESYQNLIFEDPLLERHGFTNRPRLQPAISGAKFFARGFVYPLDVIKRHHKWCDNPLGWGGSNGICGCR